MIKIMSRKKKQEENSNFNLGIKQQFIIKMILKNQNTKTQNIQEFKYRFFPQPKQSSTSSQSIKQNISIQKPYNLRSNNQRYNQFSLIQTKPFQQIDFNNRYQNIRKKYVQSKNKSQYSQETFNTNQKNTSLSKNKPKYIKDNQSIQKNQNIINKLFNNQKQQKSHVNKNLEMTQIEPIRQVQSRQIKQSFIYPSNSLKKHQDSYKLKNQIRSPKKEKNQQISIISDRIHQILKCLKQNQYQNHNKQTSRFSSLLSQEQQSQRSLYLKLNALKKNNETSRVGSSERSSVELNKRSSGIIKKVNKVMFQQKYQNQQNLDQEIKKIQQKIKKSQEQKKKLNKKFQSIKFYKDKSCQQKNKQDHLHLKIDIPQSYNKQINLSPKYEQYTDNEVKKQRIIKRPLLMDLQNAKSVKSIYEQCYNKGKNEQSKIQSKRLIQCLIKQIEYDIQLGRQRELFNVEENNNRRIYELKQQLSNYHIYLQMDQIRKQFENQKSQTHFRNPNIKRLAQLFSNSYHHWNQYLKHKFNLQKLIYQNTKFLFTITQNIFTLQSFTLFINQLTYKNFTPKHLTILFNRFTTQKKFPLNIFLQIVTNNM